nr:GvpL/GvpF family gas vesicle protein [Yoonia sp. F2084L]
MHPASKTLLQPGGHPVPSHEILAILPTVDTPAPDHRLQFVTAAGFTAVLKKSKRPTIALPQSRRQVLQDAAVRQSLLEACMPLGPLLVFRPGCHLDINELTAFVTANQPVLDRLAGQLRDMVQFQVSVSWTPPGVLDHFRSAPEITPIFQSGQTSQDALTLGITALAARLHSDIADILDGVSTDLLHLPCAEDMLINTVVLLPANHADKLDQAIELVDGIWSDGFLIKQIGPSPAASFALLDIAPITPLEIRYAIDRLGLDKKITINAIQQARRDALLRTPQDAAQIKQAVTVVEAAVRVGAFDQALMLCTVQAEGAAHAKSVQKVA